MKEHPILMSAPLVCALRDGRKTQTRRAVKHQPPDDTGNVFTGLYHPTVIDKRGDEQPGKETFGAWSADGEWATRCPYGQPGDQLYVREAYSGPHWTTGSPPRDWAEDTPIWYWADGNPDHGDWTKPKPGMHLPRWASRITLEIVSVRVERLHDISEADCIAEGAPGGHGSIPDYHYSATPREHYRHVWTTINGAGSWDLNPWLWAVEFRRLP